MAGEVTPALGWLFIAASALFSVGSILLGRALLRAGALLSEEADVPIGLAFILAGLLSVVHLIPSWDTVGTFWSLGLLASVVAVAAFLLGLAAYGLVLLRRQNTRMVQPALTTVKSRNADVRS